MTRPLLRLLTYRPSTRVRGGLDAGGAIFSTARGGALAATSRTASVGTSVAVVVALAGCLTGGANAVSAAHAADTRRQLSAADYVITPAGTPGLTQAAVNKIRAVPGVRTLELTPTQVFADQSDAALFRTAGEGYQAYLDPACARTPGSMPTQITAAVTPGAGPADARGALAAAARAAGARLTPAAQAAQQTRTAILMILGLSVLYALIALADTLVMTVADRRRELALLRLAGATPRQVLGTVLAETFDVRRGRGHGRAAGHHGEHRRILDFAASSHRPGDAPDRALGGTRGADRSMRPDRGAIRHAADRASAQPRPPPRPDARNRRWQLSRQARPPAAPGKPDGT
jgi:hypothetical protein